MVKFSIIVPVYNVEEYLGQCVESVLTQTYTNYELILVDDESSDRSGQLCDHFSKENDCIKVIHQKNGGASSARNTGIKLAKGDYLIFIDSDDYVESSNLLNEIAEQIEIQKSDIVLYGSKSYNLKSKKATISRGHYDVGKINKLDYASSMEYLIKNGLFPGSAWVFAVKENVVRNNNLKFKTNIIAEDIDWVTKVFKHCRTIDAVNDVYYIYRKNQSNSVTGTAGVFGVKSIMGIIEEWSPLLQAQGTELNKYLLHNLGYYYFTSFVLFSKLGNSDKEDMMLVMKHNFNVTQFVITPQLKLLRILCKLFGISLVSSLIGSLYNIRERIF